MNHRPTCLHQTKHQNLCISNLIRNHISVSLLRLVLPISCTSIVRCTLQFFFSALFVIYTLYIQYTCNVYLILPNSHSNDVNLLLVGRILLACILITLAWTICSTLRFLSLIKSTCSDNWGKKVNSICTQFKAASNWTCLLPFAVRDSGACAARTASWAVIASTTRPDEIVKSASHSISTNRGDEPPIKMLTSAKVSMRMISIICLRHFTIQTVVRVGQRPQISSTFGQMSLVTFVFS